MRKMRMVGDHGDPAIQELTLDKLASHLPPRGVGLVASSPPGKDTMYISIV